MFAPFSRLFHRRPEPADLERAFVRDLRVEHPREPRSRRVELVLAVGWLLVIAKCLLVHWAIARYGVPFNGAWLIVPTLAFATLCTVIYWRRD